MTARSAFLTAQPFAHRGLHGAGVPENSLAAFRAAIATGHGIEIDVQLSRDDVPFVFHDHNAQRMTGDDCVVREQASHALDLLRLSGTGEPLPRLTAALIEIGGRVPVLIEAKVYGVPPGALCLAIRRALEGYRGAAAVMSFDPQVSAWFREHAPRVPRGLVVTERGSARHRSPFGGTVARWLALRHAKPDFLAYDVADLPSRFADRHRRRGLPVLCWTVRSSASERLAMIHADQIIYERR